MPDYNDFSFKKTFHGYDPEEVNDYLNDLQSKYDELSKKNESMSKELAAYNEKKDEIDKSLKNAEAEERSANLKAAAIVADARRQYNSIVTNLVAQIDEEKELFNKMKNSIADFKTEIFRQYAVQIQNLEEIDKTIKRYDEQVDIPADFKKEPEPDSIEFNEPPAEPSRPTEKKEDAEPKTDHIAPTVSSDDIINKKEENIRYESIDGSPKSDKPSQEDDDDLTLNMPQKKDPEEKKKKMYYTGEFYKEGDTEYRSGTDGNMTSEVDSLDSILKDTQDDNK